MWLGKKNNLFKFTSPFVGFLLVRTHCANFIRKHLVPSCADLVTLTTPTLNKHLLIVWPLCLAFPYYTFQSLLFLCTEQMIKTGDTIQAWE